MFPDDMMSEARRLLDALRQRSLTVATAESCTGGLIIGLLTEIAGSSDVVDRGFVTYSNQAKMELLGVPAGTLTTYGAVSGQTAIAMAQGALIRSAASLAVAVTGVAGPGGGSTDKPVGLVHFALAMNGQQTRHREERFGDVGRSAVRLATVRTALAMIAGSPLLTRP